MNFLNLNIDTSLGGENASDTVVSSQKAIKAYIDAQATTVLTRIFNTSAATTQFELSNDFDMVQVYLDGLMATENVNYTVADKIITFETAVPAGTEVKFVTFKIGVAVNNYVPQNNPVFTGGVKEKTVVSSDGTINLNSGNCFTYTVSANTTISIINAGSFSKFTLILTNGGSKTITWPSSMRWEKGTLPELTQSGVDVLTFVTPDSGATWFGYAEALDAKVES